MLSGRVADKYGEYQWEIQYCILKMTATGRLLVWWTDYTGVCAWTNMSRITHEQYQLNAYVPTQQKTIVEFFNF